LDEFLGSIMSIYNADSSFFPNNPLSLKALPTNHNERRFVFLKAN